MTALQEAAMRKALEALEVATTPFAKDRQEVLGAIKALRSALAQQGEPVAWINIDQTIGPDLGKQQLSFGKYHSLNPLRYKYIPLYAGAAPAAQPLTDEQLEAMWEADTTSDDDCKSLYYFKVVARAVEREHKIGSK